MKSKIRSFFLIVYLILCISIFVESLSIHMKSVFSPVYSLNKINKDGIVKSFCKSAILLLPTICVASQIKSDEIEVEFNSDYIGLGLVEVDYKKSKRIVVQSVKTDSEAAKSSEIKAGMIVVSVNGKNTETSTLTGLAKLIRESERPLKIVFRDPNLFFTQLDGSLGNSTALAITAVRPGGKSIDYPEEILQVQRIEVNKSNFCLDNILYLYTSVIHMLVSDRL